MLNVMIVDDEANVREGLKEVIDWNAYGFKIVCDVPSAEMALRKYEEYLPDVVITDICMPDKNGLNLLLELKQINPKVEFMILSGYPDFYYSKSAFEAGALVYLLKPLEIDELIKALKKVKQHVEMNKIVSEHFLFNLLRLTMPSEDSISSLCQKYSVTLPDTNYFVTSIQIDNNTKDSSDAYPTLLSLLRAQFTMQNNIYICQPNDDLITLLIFCSNVQMQTTIYSLLNEVKETYKSKTLHTLTIGISTMTDSILFIRDAFLQSLFAVSQKALKGRGYMIYYKENGNARLTNDSLNVSLLIDSSEIADLITGITSSNKDLVFRILDNYFSNLECLEQINVDVVKNNLSELAIQIIHFSAKNTDETKLIYGKIPNPISDIQNLTYLNDMHDYLKDLIEKVFNYREFKNSSKFSKLVQSAQTYIMMYYSLQLSVPSIAEHVHAERTYLMRRFKAETGITINEFLTNYRIRMASNLIESKQYQIQEISSMVGYTDAKYFSKVFKKITGYTPSEYANMR